MENIHLVIISGLSGSGKSTAIKALEDIGFFCVDNLPVILLPKFLELSLQAPGEISKVALVMDIRERGFLKEYPRIFHELKNQGHMMEIIFLECSDEILLRRFSETRRSHPMAEGKSVLEGIKLERESLSHLRSMANKVIDTSHYNVHQLKESIRQYFSEVTSLKRMTINLLSFGYKYGLPYDADLIMDVRFLPNPYFIEELKTLSGENQEVLDYVLHRKESQDFLRKFSDLIYFLIPLYESEGKSYLTIAIGCTGGRHRSVAVINELAGYLKEESYHVTIRHRDIENT
ncbi:MAG: RNase adapter RapZ [Thermodesulfobacteriota bacterium]|nr:RNase adapter RapZ [Thermodesulfobacteriota bacterium]